MRIGILQAGHFALAEARASADNDALVRRMLAGRGFEFQTWNVVDMAFPEGPEAADAWVITGSKFGVYEPEPFIAPLEDLVRAIYAARRPLVGLCFGHQIIAQALGGRVEKFGGGWQVGATEYDMGGETVTLTAWHQDQVIAPPREATVIGTAPGCANAMLLYGAQALTIQPHPEYDAEELLGLIEVRGGALDPSLRAAATESAARPLSNAHLADRIAAFLEVAHG